MDYYHWIESFHVISIISWMAGMLYLPRIYVYHAGVSVNSDSNKLLKIMEKRLLRYILNPAMVLSIIFGLSLVVMSGAYTFVWFHIKATAVLALVVVHFLLAKYRKDFEKDVNNKSPLYFRILNEAVTFLIIVIVIAVVVKPFK